MTEHKLQIGGENENIFNAIEGVIVYVNRKR